MGYIRKTPAGTFQADWRDPTGRKRSKTFKTKREASAFLAETESSMNQGAYVDPHAGKARFGAFAERWAASRDVDARSAERVRSVMRTHLLPRWGQWPLAKIEHLAVQAWVTDLGRQVSPATVRKAFGVFSQVMTAAVRSRLIPVTPCVGVRIKGSSVTVLNTISREEFLAKLLPAVPAEHRALVAVAGGTGLRWGELAGLPWASVDLLAARLRVTQVAVETAEAVWIKPSPKTRAGVRTVPLPRFALDELSRLRAGLEEEPGPHDLVFDTRNGTLLRRSNFRRQVWRPALVRAGLLGRVVSEGGHRFVAYWFDAEGLECSAVFATEREAVAQVALRAADGLRFHDLRHSYATWLVSDGMPVNVVQRVMGHQKATTTLNLYTHAPSDYDARIRGTFGDAAEDSPSFGAEESDSAPPNGGADSSEQQ